MKLIMDLHKVAIAIFGLLISTHIFAKTVCLPGVYSDGEANAIVLYNKLNESAGLGYLTLDGFFGSTASDSVPFQCQSDYIRLNNHAATHLPSVPLRRTLTTFISANTQLTGELIEPLNSNQNTYPLVVMVHGSEQEPAIGNTRALLLAGMGIAVFVYDKRGTGQSEGFYTQNFKLLAEDAAAAMNHARSLTTGRSKRIGFWGASQGGWVAPLAATLTPVDFVVVSYGLVASPIEEDLDQMLLEAERQKLNAGQLKQIRHLSKITARILLSHFKDGLGELEVLRRELKSQQWITTIKGEYSGEMLRMSDEDLRRIGRPVFDNLELIWDYDALPVLKKIQLPMLWIIAEKDREAPVQRTLQALNILKKENPMLKTWIFPDTDHGIYEFNELPDGSRKNVRIADGYFRLVADWINGKEPSYSGRGFLN